MRPRSANEWRRFWHEGRESELEQLLRDSWPPLHDAAEETCEAPAERVALLLGSAASPRALASELGRIRDELGVVPDPHTDRATAETLLGWFDARASS
jgi:hypothetical protein